MYKHCLVLVSSTNASPARTAASVVLDQDSLGAAGYVERYQLYLLIDILHV